MVRSSRREGEVEGKTAQRSHTRGSDPPRTHPAVSCPKRDTYPPDARGVASPPSACRLVEPWQPCRGQHHDTHLTWASQPTILVGGDLSASLGMRPPAAARLAGCGGAMGQRCPSTAAAPDREQEGQPQGRGEARRGDERPDQAALPVRGATRTPRATCAALGRASGRPACPSTRRTCRCGVRGRG